MTEEKTLGELGYPGTTTHAPAKENAFVQTVQTVLHSGLDIEPYTSYEIREDSWLSQCHGSLDAYPNKELAFCKVETFYDESGEEMGTRATPITNIPTQYRERKGWDRLQHEAWAWFFGFILGVSLTAATMLWASL